MNQKEIKAARIKLGLTQHQFATSLGTPQDGTYSVRAVGSWEDGTNQVPPAVAKLVRLMLRVKK